MSVSRDHPQKVFTCIRCFERKVKCDKLNPCSNCTRSKAECVFRVPPPARRRKKQTPEAQLLERLKKYEELLRSNGIVFEHAHSTLEPSLTPSLSICTPTQQIPERRYDINQHPAFFQYQNAQSGQLLVDRGKSRFIENNLWVNASSEVQHSFYRQLI